jgi:hypothetical protein
MKVCCIIRHTLIWHLVPGTEFSMLAAMLLFTLTPVLGLQAMNVPLLLCSSCSPGGSLVPGLVSKLSQIQ